MHIKACMEYVSDDDNLIGDCDFNVRKCNGTGGSSTSEQCAIELPKDSTASLNSSINIMPISEQAGAPPRISS